MLDSPHRARIRRAGITAFEGLVLERARRQAWAVIPGVAAGGYTGRPWILLVCDGYSSA